MRDKQTTTAAEQFWYFRVTPSTLSPCRELINFKMKLRWWGNETKNKFSLESRHRVEKICQHLLSHDWFYLDSIVLYGNRILSVRSWLEEGRTALHSNKTCSLKTFKKLSSFLRLLIGISCHRAIYLLIFLSRFFDNVRKSHFHFANARIFFFLSTQTHTTRVLTYLGPIQGFHLLLSSLSLSKSLIFSF